MDLGSIRAVYKKQINRHLGSIRGRAGQQPDEAVSKFAEKFARKIAKSSAAPKEAQHALADLTFEFLGVFYGVDEELASNGLAALWEKTAPYLGSEASRPSSLADIHPQDDDLASWAQYLKEMASLTAQREALTSATDYELIRARRMLHLVLGRLAPVAECGEEFQELGRRLLIVLGRPAVPILITVLREDSLRHKAVSFILDLMRRLGQMTRGSSTKVHGGSA